MHFSKKSQYGLRAAVTLAQRDSDDYVSIETLSKDLDIPVQYLRKILRLLTEHGITESSRGPNGGVRLDSDGCETTIRSLLELLEGEEVFDSCPVGFPECTDSRGCVLGDDCPIGHPVAVQSCTDVPLRRWAEKIPPEAS